MNFQIISRGIKYSYIKISIVVEILSFEICSKCFRSEEESFFNRTAITKGIIISIITYF